ncbi:MAG TPA: sodium:proton antiporter [Steroidobacteraceae bacterium]|nr:sodium:proton antiporter [Steroidobacteraceae bacterium]
MEASSTLISARALLWIVAVILASGAVCRYLAGRARIPDIVLYLLAGMLLGPSVTGVITVAADSELNQVALLIGASFILFDGGAALRLRVLKQVWITIVVIATLGVLITGAITGLAAQYFLGVPLGVALLLGATLASTDPATLVPVFRQIHIRERVSQTVISESALNDAVAAIFTFSVLGVLLGTQDFNLAHATRELAWSAGIGLLLGAMIGYGAALLIAHDRLGFLQESVPLVALVSVIGASLAAARFGASGLMAVFIAGVVIGNRDALGLKLGVREEGQLEDFMAMTSLVMRIFIFVLLGTQVDLTLVREHLWPAIAVVCVLMLIARPLTVFICAAPDRRARWSLQELLFMCWARETGVIPAALAGMLAGARAPQADVIAAVTFMAILLTILVQATTTRWLAQRLGLLEQVR